MGAVSARSAAGGMRAAGLGGARRDVGAHRRVQRQHVPGNGRDPNRAGDLYVEAIQQESSIGAALWEALGERLDRFYVEKGPPRSWSNQAGSFDRADAPHVWKGMRFRSYSEQVIAEALDRACLDFQPNCLLRSGEVPDDRSNVEPDFVIYAHGRIGVLEVDGEPWHSPENAAAEHVRDRRFRSKGWIVERFDAEECRNFPDDVVAQFLQVLRARS